LRARLPVSTCRKYYTFFIALTSVDVIKYFGFELGAQTNTNPTDDRWIINGAHEAGKLQDYLDGFISRFVLCKKCKNPETDVNIKDGMIVLDCKACGQRTDVDLRLKLSSFILKNQPKKGKKDKSTKKAERKAKREGQNGTNDGSDNGSHDSNGDDADQNGDYEQDAGSDDELTRNIKKGADAIDVADTGEVKWTVDMSEEAVKARAKELPTDLKNSLSLNDGEDDEEGGESGSAYDTLGAWIQDQTKEKGGVTKVDSVDIYKKAMELNIEVKHRTLTVLAQTIFDEDIVKQIPGRASMLKKFISGSERHQRALLGGIERFVGNDHPDLIPQVSPILMQLYQQDVIDEEVASAWASKVSTKYVEKPVSKKVRKSAAAFVKWLEEAEEESDDE
jgi:translation initiation factor 5